MAKQEEKLREKPDLKQNRFTKEQLLASKRWSGIERDLIQALLANHMHYSEAEVSNRMQQYYKKGVK